MVTIGVVQEPDHLLLAFTPLRAAALALAPLYWRPVQHDERWRPHPTYIERIPVPGSEDWELLPRGRMRVRFRFRSGLKWHDGAACDARDTEWTWRMWMSPEVMSVVTKSDDVKVSDMTCPDPLTLVVTWEERTPNANIGHRCLPRHLLAGAFASDPANIASHEYGTRPVGNGPFRFGCWVRGSHLDLERAAPAPLMVNRLRFRFFADFEQLLGAWRADELDLVPDISLPLDRVLELEREFSGFQFTYRPALIVERLDFNLDHLAVGVRRALAAAIDRQSLVERTTAGRLPVADSWLPPGHPDYIGALASQTPGPEPRAALADAGWSERDGLLEPPTGPLTLVTTDGDPLRHKLVEGIVGDLFRAGIRCQPQFVPAQQLFTDILPRRKFRHLALYAWSMHLHAMGFGAWHSSQVPSEENGWQGRNYPGWRNPESDRLLVTALSELDDQRRASILARQQRLFAAEVPCLPLLARAEVVASRRNLVGIRPTGLSVAPVTWNAHQWRWSDREEG